MAPRVSSGTPLWRPIDKSSSTIVLAARNAASMSPADFSMMVGSVVRSSSNGPGGVGGVENDRQRRDIERDQVGGVFGEVLVGGKDGGDRLADIAHGMLRQRGLAVGLQRGQAGEPEADRRNVGDVGVGPHRVHAGQSERRAGVDRFDISMRQRRAHDAHGPLAGKRNVGGEAALAGKQRAVFQTRDGTADEFLFGLGHCGRLIDTPFIPAQAGIQC